MKPILEISNLSKKYAISDNRLAYRSLREELKNVLKRRSGKQDFWALKDVEFEAFEGDCIGIIGRNGAGKSTLLKILSRITPPTTGDITLRGRVASLLEVGTGFHPELTGRENIYLNGAILGLQKREIKEKFDAIIDFSGVEKFLETPLKHYSSGMQLRLAFAVAAHLEPEILIVDEVLAVGDAEFQEKCIGKMTEVVHGGRTVLFVSHDMNAITKLCKKGIILNHGKIVKTGAINDVVATYSNKLAADLNSATDSIQNRKIVGDVLLKKLDINFEHNSLSINLELAEDIHSVSSIILNIFTQNGERISLIDYRPVLKKANIQGTSSTLYLNSEIDFSQYVEGVYFFTLGIEANKADWFETDRLSVDVIESDAPTQYATKYRGHIMTPNTSNIKIS